MNVLNELPRACFVADCVKELNKLHGKPHLASPRDYKTTCRYVASLYISTKSKDPFDEFAGAEWGAYYGEAVQVTQLHWVLLSVDPEREVSLVEWLQDTRHGISPPFDPGTLAYRTLVYKVRKQAVGCQVADSLDQFYKGVYTGVSQFSEWSAMR
jgi:hypothetical protein